MPGDLETRRAWGPIVDVGGFVESGTNGAITCFDEAGFGG
jgi:hypothetical protein